jgi:thiol-disulfide isomerase/thioredoxin
VLREEIGGSLWIDLPAKKACLMLVRFNRSSLSMKTLLALVFLFGIASVARANAETDEPVASTAAALAAIQNEYKLITAAAYAALESLPDTPEGNEQGATRWHQLEREQAEVLAKVVELVRSDPGSETGFAALLWMTKNAGDHPMGAVGLELMTEHYAAAPSIGNAVAGIAYYIPWSGSPSHQPTVNFLKAVAEKNPDRTIRGQAALGLASLTKRRIQRAEWDADPNLGHIIGEAEEAFEAILRDYGDCPNLRSVGIRPAQSTLREEAERELHEIQNLALGKIAPEIEGEDLDGTQMTLSEHRGKVVLLVFWASWCAPCMAEVPGEKELVERFKGRPFVLVGVNGDYSKAAAAKAVIQHEISWRSFWNGEKGPGGPIPLAWNVKSWPTTYVIDHQGTIRHKNISGTLGDKLETLVTAAEETVP